MADSKLVKKTNPLQLRLAERRLLLMIGDFLVGVIALISALVFWGSTLRFIDFNLAFLQERVPNWFYFLPIVWPLLLTELYDIHNAGNWKRTLRGVLIAGLIGWGLYLIVYIIYVGPPRSALPRLGVASFLVVVVLLTLGWRALYIRIFTAPEFMRNVLLVGGGKTGQIMLQIINNLEPKPFRMIGIIDDDPNKIETELEGCPVLGSSERLLDLISDRGVSDLIVAISGEMNGRMFQALLDAQECGVEITRMPVAYEELLGRVPIQWLEADWILRSFVDVARSRGFYELWKRVLDIIGGLIGTLVFLILMPLISIVILLDDGRPVFYSQLRSGRGGQAYTLYKFRTMRRDAEADGKAQSAKENDERTIRSGRFLRKVHLDELPQFLTVLRGEMSLVGPRAERPELVIMFQKHVPFYRARLLVKPGITGWAQVNQNYAASIDETITKLEYDLYYIKRRSLALDLIILLRTPSMMLGLRGR
jgi:exopolysaccharide biosynthesis polyprenyl glycosylphosphotransferase